MQSRACMPKTMLGGTCKLGASRTRWINRRRASQVCDMFRHGSGRSAADSSLLFLLIAFCSGSFRHRCAFGSISSPPLHSIPQSKTAMRLPENPPTRKQPASFARARLGNNTARLRHGARPSNSPRAFGTGRTAMSLISDFLRGAEPRLVIWVSND